MGIICQGGVSYAIRDVHGNTLVNLEWEKEHLLISIYATHKKTHAYGVGTGLKEPVAKLILLFLFHRPDNPVNRGAFLTRTFPSIPH